MASHRERKMQPCKKQMTPFNNLHHMDRPPAPVSHCQERLFPNLVSMEGKLNYFYPFDNTMGTILCKLIYIIVRISQLLFKITLI